MYTIDFDSKTKRVDVSFIVARNDHLHINYFSNAMCGLNLEMRHIIESAKLASQTITLHGPSKIWYQDQEDNYPKGYCKKELLLAFDQMHESNALYVTNSSVTMVNNGTILTDLSKYRFSENSKGVLACRFIVDIEKIEFHHNEVALVTHDVHIKGML